MLRYYHYIAYLGLGLFPLCWTFWPDLGKDSITSSTFLQSFFLVPYLTLLILSIMGLKLNLTRIFLVSLVFLLNYLCLNQAQLFAPLKLGLFSLPMICAFATPTAFCLLFFGRETRPFSLRFLVRLITIFAPFAATAALFLYAQDYFIQATRWTVYPVSKLRIPQLALIPIVIFGLLSIRRHQKIRIFVNALLITLVPLYLCYNVALDSSISPEIRSFQISIGMGLISLVLLHVMFSLYWQRVYIDELTEVPNRRAMDEYLQTLTKDYTIAMIDIDLFKKFNDDHGHYEGDNILRMVAAMLMKTLPGKVFRYGGEEFAAIFPSYSTQDSFRVLDKTREKVFARKFVIRKDLEERETQGKERRGKSYVKKESIQISFSAGIADSRGKKNEHLRVMKLADKALYTSKNNGRNQVTIYAKEVEKAPETKRA